MNENEQQKILGVGVNAVTLAQAIATLRCWMDEPLKASGCRYVVTPNLDHARLLRDDEGLQSAYRDASFVIPDGMPFVWAAKLMGRPIPQRVAGSDLVPGLLADASAARPLTYYLLGAAPGVAETAAKKIETQYPFARCVGCLSPDFGFEKDPEACAQIIAKVNEAKPDLLVLGFGAPKQELWIGAHHQRVHAKVAVCAGATIDFLAGQVSRAPKWMQKSGLEWAHRMLSQPQRLFPRYARDAAALPGLLWRDWRDKN